MTLKYDLDGDGMLNEKERDTMRKDRLARRQYMDRGNPFRRPPAGFGPPPGFEPQGNRESNIRIEIMRPPGDNRDPIVLTVPKAMVLSFDKNGDGSLDDKEIEAFKEALKKQIQSKGGAFPD